MTAWMWATSTHHLRRVTEGDTNRRNHLGNKQQLKQLRHFQATRRVSALVFHFISDILRHAGIYSSVDVGYIYASLGARDGREHQPARSSYRINNS